MTSTRNPLQDFILTPQQQTLLFAALNSNKTLDSPNNNAMNLSPSSYNDSPVQRTDGLAGFQDSPLLDDYDFGGDSSFDFSFDNGGQPKMIGDLPGGSSSSKSETPDQESSPEKRSHPDEDEETGGTKRRESEEKVAKKPGRKPLTSEPSSKRKAQNRAAQRAFRERKEKHLKDLETKVEELEKASESAKQENGALRAQLDKMTVELSEYKKRMSLVTNGRSTVPATSRLFGQPVINNINDVNFQFEFPKFGALPGPPVSKSDASRRSPSAGSPLDRAGSEQISPMNTPALQTTRSNSTSYSQIGLDSKTRDDIAAFSAGLFSPPLTSNSHTNLSRGSLDSHLSMGGATATSSPSASSNSNHGPSSSCGTSPEPFTQSPMGFKPVDTMTTIGEEQSSIASPSQDSGHFAAIDISQIDWLATQNNFQFDPQLFGDYREPQESVLSNGGLDDNFFNEAFDVDFTTPYNAVPSPAVPKTNLLAQIDAAKDKDEDILGPDGRLLTCNKIWEKLQNCPKVQAGEFDLDGLCSELQKKAKCSGSGPVVGESDFKSAMKKYLGKTDEEIMAGCPDSKSEKE